MIDQRDFFNKVVAAKDMSNYYLLKKGEFAYNKSYSNGFDYGSVKRLNAYEQGCLSTLYICFGITSDEVESDYLECFFDTLKWYGDVSMICAEGARNHGLLNVDTKGFFDEVTIDLPRSLEEQKKISAYLNALDNLVTLHQRKPTDLYKIVINDWEQRKFGELVEKYEDPVDTPTDGYMRLGIRSHAKGTFHSYVEAGKELETAKMFRVAANNFIVNITFGWEHAVAITDENDAGKLVSHRFPQYSFKEGMLPKFFRYLILDECFKHHLELSSPGGAGRNRVLKLSDMLEYKMIFPSETEQQKIGAYFDSLDKLITLHQRKF